MAAGWGLLFTASLPAKPMASNSNCTLVTTPYYTATECLRLLIQPAISSTIATFQRHPVSTSFLFSVIFSEVVYAVFEVSLSTLS